jgi:hypothetical protein
MPFFAVLSLLLLLIAALGQSWWWRVPAGAPGYPWYGGAVFYWGVFFLAVFLEWPTLKALGM